MQIYETFSHTHRSFNMYDMPKTLIDDLKKIAEKKKDLFYPLFITDHNHINNLYDLTPLPEIDKTFLVNYVPRKNSQMYAPLLILLVPKKNTLLTRFEIGKTLSELGLHAVSSGYKTGFCICYEFEKVREYLQKNALYPDSYKLFPIPFLSVGKKLFPNKPHNYQSKDVVDYVGSHKKLPTKNYVFVK